MPKSSYVGNQSRLELAASETILQMDVRRTRNLRHVRKELFGGELYSGPAWDILLHLFESQISSRRDTLRHLREDPDINESVAGRWVRRLERLGYVKLRDNPGERQNPFVDLSMLGIQTMTKYFAGVAPFLIAA